jgi:hypothetical protein
VRPSRNSRPLKRRSLISKPLRVCILFEVNVNPNCLAVVYMCAGFGLFIECRKYFRMLNKIFRSYLKGFELEVVKLTCTCTAPFIYNCLKGQEHEIILEIYSTWDPISKQKWFLFICLREENKKFIAEFFLPKVSHSTLLCLRR